jgi:hypothetical protein
VGNCSFWKRVPTAVWGTSFPSLSPAGRRGRIEAAREARGLIAPLALLALAGIVFFLAVAYLAGPAESLVAQVYAKH